MTLLGLIRPMPPSRRRNVTTGCSGCVHRWIFGHSFARLRSISCSASRQSFNVICPPQTRASKISWVRLRLCSAVGAEGLGRPTVCSSFSCVGVFTFLFRCFIFDLSVLFVAARLEDFGNSSAVAFGSNDITGYEKRRETDDHKTPDGEHFPIQTMGWVCLRGALTFAIWPRIPCRPMGTGGETSFSLTSVGSIICREQVHGTHLENVSF